MTASARKRGSVATLSVVALLWLLDLLSSGASPQPAAASGPAPASSGASAALTATPRDLSALLAEFGAERPPLPSPEFARDLFAPDELLRARLTPPPPPVVELEPSSQPAAPPEPDFASAHELTGIVWGPRPMAIIDGEPAGLGARIAGYRIIQIEREFVLLESDKQRVRLVLGPPTSRERNRADK